MLEIFRQAGKSPSHTGGSAGGPFGGAGDEGLASHGGGGNGLNGLVLLGSIGIAFILGIAVGKQLFGPGNPAEAAASEARDERDSLEEVRREESADPEQGTASPLYDPALRFTVVVAAYGNTETQTVYAWNTHDHLAAAGFEVFPPLGTGARIVVLAGAAATSDELASLQLRIRALAGWNGTDGAFGDAYIERIDKLIDR